MSPSLHTAHLALLDDHKRLPTAASFLIVVAVVVTKWDRARRTRKALKALDPHLLRDVGISARAARAESNKKFWEQ